MKSKQEEMRSRPIFSLLISMAVPMMFSMLIQSLYNIIDSIFVAKLGNDAFTAVSLIYPLQNLVIAVAVGFGIGVSSFISIAIGGNDVKRAENAASLGVIFSIVHSVLFVLFGIFATKPFLRMFTSNQDVIDMGSKYGYIVLCLAFGALIQVCYEKIFQALGNMKITMWVLTAGAVINIILDPIFIFGLLGMPQMGVAGAAVATVCGQISGLIIYLIYYRKTKHKMSFAINPLNSHFDSAIIKKLYYVGVPSTIMLALPSVLVSILNRILVGFSQLHVSVLGIYYKLQSFIYLPAGGIVQGMRPIVGFNYGAGEKKRLKDTLKVSLCLCTAIMAFGTILCLVIPAPILTLFNADAQMMEIGILALRIISLGFLVSTFGVIYSGAFEALGLGMPSLIISLLRQFIIILPLSIVLSRHVGAVGIWWSFPIAEIIAAAVAIILMKKTLDKI